VIQPKKKPGEKTIAWREKVASAKKSIWRKLRGEKKQGFGPEGIKRGFCPGEYFYKEGVSPKSAEE